MRVRGESGGKGHGGEGGGRDGVGEPPSPPPSPPSPPSSLLSNPTHTRLSSSAECAKLHWSPKRQPSGLRKEEHHWVLYSGWNCASPPNSSSQSPPAVRCHGTRYVQHARVRAWGPGASCPAPPTLTARTRLVRVARTYSTEAPGRTCQHGWAPCPCSQMGGCQSGTTQSHSCGFSPPWMR